VADHDSIRNTPTAPPERGVFANRTLNLRSVQSVGYDMDYTLIHYRVEEWEGAAFGYARDHLLQQGLPVESFVFDPGSFTIGLTFDLQLGNLIKATRFGYVVRAQHGNEMLDFEDQRRLYSESVVELAEPRFEFMNTLFELSRASLWTQLVDLHDRRPISGVSGYVDLYRLVDDALTESHVGGALKDEIVADPERFVDPDPDVVQTLLDQRLAGKNLLLITNSDWAYTKQMMAYTVDPYCPAGKSWRDLFDIVIVSANKPRFFQGRFPIYRVVDEEQSLLAPHRGLLEKGHVYFGGNARIVEESLAASGQPLYVGDHLFGDVLVTKDVLRWRTALIARELEAEIVAAMSFADQQRELERLMTEKVAIDRQQARLRLANRRNGGGSARAELDRTNRQAMNLDQRIAPLAAAASSLGNPNWGPLMRAGNDKSLFARQVERYADVYTSRVSNLRYETPYGYLRAARGSLPHDNAAEPDDQHADWDAAGTVGENPGNG
jgi:HAD superfamily 5'-nucleotidase-like hydrolase